VLPRVPPPPDVAAPPTDARKTASGLAYQVLSPGTGTEHPHREDKVRVNYNGWTKAGEMFDSSLARGNPAVFGLSHVIPGWTEALQLMVTGERRRLWVPASLAYGDKPAHGEPAGDLVFDVELLEIINAPTPPPIPDDLIAIPSSAKRTESGLAYRVLKPGTGQRPKPDDVVVVHYSGWTTDGHMFDSSVMLGQPLVTHLDQVIKGWNEGIRLMKVGEKTRFWIPADLAYGEHPARAGMPAGNLVFDIELLGVDPLKASQNARRPKPSER
jgi:peptidylprolyl isomerase